MNGGRNTVGPSGPVRSVTRHASMQAGSAGIAANHQPTSTQEPAQHVHCVLSWHVTAHGRRRPCRHPLEAGTGQSPVLPRSRPLRLPQTSAPPAVVAQRESTEQGVGMLSSAGQRRNTVTLRMSKPAAGGWGATPTSGGIATVSRGGNPSTHCRDCLPPNYCPPSPATSAHSPSA